MPRPLLFLLLSLLFFSACTPSIPSSEEIESIKIVRDKWGVPHIFAPTDAEVAYGLAWAECEDDFVTLQEQMLAIRGKLGEVKGKDGITVDFGVKFMGIRETVDAHYESAIEGAFKKYLESFVKGINSYAALHPKEVLLTDLFPLTEKDVLMGYLLGNVEISGAGRDLVKILEGKLKVGLTSDLPKGSNAIAVSRKKTKDNKTYLAINSHQPLEGWYSWYEAHLVSEEGLNILGGTFPGGLCIFHGVNENLGWAHTVNHADFSDVYQLTMHPDKDLKYRFDGQWLTLKEKPYWSWLKLFGPVKIPIRKTIYESKYGPTFETDQGFFAWRFVVAQDLGAAAQWYAMNKASNFQEFQTALEMGGIVSTNIVYADKADNIYYLSNAKIPIRNPNYDWKDVLPGDTSATLWANKYFPLDSLPQVENPASGYVFNTNNTPFSSSGVGDNPIEDADNKTMGFQTTGIENNRSLRFMELMNQQDSLDYETFKKIKYDTRYPDQLTSPKMTNLELLLNLNSEKYPAISEAIQLLNNWDRDTKIENITAPLFIISLSYMIEKLKEEDRYIAGNKISEADCVFGIAKAQEELLAKYQTLNVPLGKVQKHIRGDVELPVAGGPDVLAAMYSKKNEEGIYKGVAGESYISLVRFSEDGVEVETVNAYGTCAEPGDAHFTDQMSLFTQQALKPMSLDKATVMQEAVKTYSPRRVVK